MHPAHRARPVAVPRAFARRVPRRTVPEDPHPRLPAVPPAAARFGALCREARAQGLPVEHCNGRACKSAGGCACACDSCARLHAFDEDADTSAQLAAPP
jgi:hypothetical protein